MSDVTLDGREYEELWAKAQMADRYKAALEKIRKVSGRIMIEHIIAEALLPTPCGGPHRRDCYCEHFLEHCCAAHCCWCSTKPPGATP